MEAKKTNVRRSSRTAGTWCQPNASGYAAAVECEHLSGPESRHDRIGSSRVRVLNRAPCRTKVLAITREEPRIPQMVAYAYGRVSWRHMETSQGFARLD